MSKFDLRDISDRLTRSKDTEAVVFEFLGYLQAMRPDWRMTLAFYEVSHDTIEHLYERQGTRLVRRDVKLAVDQLPARLVRKFFHPSAFFNQSGRRALLSHLFHASPAYEPDPGEAPLMRPLLPVASWQSCVCLALADQEDVLALLTIATDRKAAFGSRVVSELIPLKSMAALAIAQHLHRARAGAVPDERAARAAAAEFQERIRRLTTEAQELEADNRAKAAKLEALSRELEGLDRNSSGHRQELAQVKQQLAALETQTAEATQHLTRAYTELTTTSSELRGHEQTIGFLKNVFQMLSQDHDPDDFSHTLVSWFCAHFGVERCSLMVPDPSQETLSIAAQKGIAPEVAARARVRIGQGVAGWVAHNRKPLLVRARTEDTPHTGQDTYNSDSFVSVPLVHGNRLLGVLNLSNKRDGEPFEQLDLDRAMLAGSVLAMSLAGREAARRVTALAG